MGKRGFLVRFHSPRQSVEFQSSANRIERRSSSQRHGPVQLLVRCLDSPVNLGQVQTDLYALKLEVKSVDTTWGEFSPEEGSPPFKEEGPDSPQGSTVYNIIIIIYVEEGPGNPVGINSSLDNLSSV